MKMPQLYQSAVGMLLWLSIVCRVGESAQSVLIASSSRVAGWPALYSKSNAFMQLGIRRDKAVIVNVIDALRLDTINKRCGSRIMHRLRQFMAYAQERPSEFSIETMNGRISRLVAFTGTSETHQYLADMLALPCHFDLEWPHKH